MAAIYTTCSMYQPKMTELSIFSLIGPLQLPDRDESELIRQRQEWRSDIPIRPSVTRHGENSSGERSLGFIPFQYPLPHATVQFSNEPLENYVQSNSKIFLERASSGSILCITYSR